MDLKTFVIFLAFLCVCSWPAASVRLLTKSRWIVDEESGGRVKLACVNLVSHLESMLTEGLNRQPLKYIANTVFSQGFNCVRLTWATFMVTKPEYQSLTVTSSLMSLNLSSAVDGIRANNPEFLDLSLIEALKRVAMGLGEAGLMVILDNQVSKPQWCCALHDGNAFFGDEYFDPQAWLLGLTTVASAFINVSAVVGMSLRNELRGPRSNLTDWYTYMQAGAAAVHAANPDVLVILSGLNYDADLKFLAAKPVNLLGFGNKIVYELHWYSFTDGNAWEKGNANDLCGSVTARINDHMAFVVRNSSTFSASPLFVSEFGIDQRGVSVKDNKYINCFLAFAADGDFEWALWTLQGSYYLRNKQPGFEETYGIFNARWDGLRNPVFVAKLKPLQQPFQVPFSSSQEAWYQIIYHPASGLCVAVSKGDLKLDSCDGHGLFAFKASEEALGLSDDSQCIAAQGEGQAPVLSGICNNPNSAWQIVSTSKLQIAVNGSIAMLCLDGRSSPLLLTSKCICLMDSGCGNDEALEMQWFKVISTNRKYISNSTTT
ncbi:hypothetical protein SUGI_0771340 [Cryptomeria japonica]|uniref:glycosyl hydrolase 5 family protein n=1 Tax=Cryptomeria japonica TaxID=3369 RepID=UPI0024149501|nr:glycosyl hydrolase 5 family protein [Cryptomeria japonica]GLJ37916.1 hypothetical protein SUGI_0771340 [Cryptomeria japonica]